jgi:hypothetical protein
MNVVIFTAQKIGMFILFFIVCNAVQAQSLQDSTTRSRDAEQNLSTIDLDIYTQEKTKEKWSPKKVSLISLVIPGAGHIYNKRGAWIKVPITLGALGGAIYAINFNGNNLNLLQDAYCQKLATTPVGNPTRKIPCPPLSNASIQRANTFEFLVENPRYTSASLRSLRNNYDRQYQLSWVGLVVSHLLLNGVWSFVDAHLNDFDISDDLSIKIAPEIQMPTSLTPASVGVMVAIQF